MVAVVQLFVEQPHAHQRLFLAQPETLLERSRQRHGLLRQKLFQQLAHDAAMLLDELSMHVDREFADIEIGPGMIQKVAAHSEQVRPSTVFAQKEVERAGILPVFQPFPASLKGVMLPENALPSPSLHCEMDKT